MIISIVLLSFAAAPALGATVTQAPTISGGTTPGSQLTASVGAGAPASATPAYDWLRCGISGGPCAPISGACGRRYRVTTDDEGHSLRVRLTVPDSAGESASGISAPTGEVKSRRYAEHVEPTDTCVHVTPTGPGQGTFTSGVQTGGGTLPAPNTSLRFIDPFPIVRISGRFKDNARSSRA